MPPMTQLGRWLIAAGLALAIVGSLLLLLQRLGLTPGQLPGDFRIQTERMTCFIPLASSVLISLLLTVLLNLLLRLIAR